MRKELSLVDHVYRTYHVMRIALAITCFAIPVGLIVFGGMTGVSLQDTLSDYYYAEFPPKLMRTLFVGLLAVMGILLLAYRGFTHFDNRLHNFAGIFAFGVAIFPMQCPYDDPYSRQFELCYSFGPTGLHYISALLLFGCAILSIKYVGGDRLKNLFKEHLEDKIDIFKFWRLISGLVILCGFIYAALMLTMGGKDLLGRHGWIPESLGFIGFGMYWAFLTYYISIANSRARKPKEGAGREAIQGMVAAEENEAVYPTSVIP